MSCYVVSNNHIGVLVQYAFNKDVYLWHDGIWYKYWTFNDGVSLPDDLPEGQKYITKNELGQALLNKNYESVNNRYDENELPPEYKHSLTYTVIDNKNHRPIQIIKACNCYDYQCDNADDYENSFAAEVIDRIRSSAINSLPEYNNAKWGVWEIEIDKKNNKVEQLTLI